mgnify:CR=1 FL=1
MLLGNSADFDAIRARYQSLSYPTPEQAAFNATRASYEGLLTGSGYNTMMTPTSTPGQQVSFSVDPNTGQVTTNIPQYDIPTFENIYQTDEGLIGADGRPREASPVMGQPLPVVEQRGSGGDGFERLQRFKDDQARNALRKEIEQFNFRQLPDAYEPKLPGTLGFLEGLLGNIPRDMAINKIMQDIDRGQTFDQAIANSTYQGSSAMEKDRSPEDRVAPTSGPSGDDSSLGKGSNKGGNQGGGRFSGDRNVGDASNIGGTGGRRGGAGRF